MSMKALAGPKHVVNVRFNSETYRDPKNKNADAELFAIKTHEVLVRSRNPRRSTRQRITGVQSWYSDTATFDNEYTFAGVAETPQNADHRQSYQQGLVMCVEGMVKAYNESGKMIKSGDYLTYAPNIGRTCQPGIPRQKKRVTFIKYDNEDPVHKRRGIVARAESGARNLEAFDAHVFAHMQYNGQDTPSIAEILAISIGKPYAYVKGILDSGERIFAPPGFHNRVRAIHGEAVAAEILRLYPETVDGEYMDDETDDDARRFKAYSNVNLHGLPINARLRVEILLCIVQAVIYVLH